MKRALVVATLTLFAVALLALVSLGNGGGRREPATIGGALVLASC